MSESSAPNQRPKRLLILTASIGAGHNSVARALKEALTAASPQVEISLVDAMDYTYRWFRAYYAGGFVLCMTRLPLAYAIGYVLTNRPQTPHRGPSEQVHLAVERLGTRPLRRFLLQMQPDLIVNTHFVAVPLIARMIAGGQLTCRQMVVVTDIEVHRWWYGEGVDRWFLPSEYSADFLRRWGMSEDRLTVAGIPLAAKWTAPLDRAKIYRDWSLPDDKPIVLLSGGTEFVCGPVASIARRITQTRNDVHVVVLAGRSKKLLEKLTPLAAANPRIRPLSFTDRGHELATVASLMITKPGGVMTAECLAKALPMVLLKPVPGHEGGNAAFLAHNGAAVITTDANDVVRTTLSLLDCPARLAEMSAQARRLHRPATQTVADAIIKELAWINADECR